ncbi:MAG: carbon starvation CstA family protein [Rikenellaceae bacterium]
MITFTVALLLLIGGYFTYGKFVEKIFGPDKNRKTPAITQADGVDFIAMPTWKIFMIQFLNIAGLGPIFGAIMGAKFGVASYLWIVLGTILAGATHDYISGMLSLRHNGESLPEVVGRYLGITAKQLMRGISILLMVLVGAVFVSGPAGLLESLTPGFLNVTSWIVIIFAYYFLATFLPVDKIIGRIYPAFAAALLFMALGVLFMIFWHQPDLPEITTLGSVEHPDMLDILPYMFVSIACGAISGFHATQSPMMARCMKNEKYGRPIFYGAMVAEGIVTLIWAAAAMSYFGEHGMAENNAAIVVNDITYNWLGAFGGVLALLGVILAPITTGDTVLRSARLIVADMFHIDQRNLLKRILVCLPIFGITLGLLIYSIQDANGFNIIWRYLSWLNQLLAVFTLWAVTVYLVQQNKLYVITLVPALFMTAICSIYIFMAPEGLGLSKWLSYGIGGGLTLVSMVWFAVWQARYRRGRI